MPRPTAAPTMQSNAPRTPPCHVCNTRPSTAPETGIQLGIWRVRISLHAASNTTAIKTGSTALLMEPPAEILRLQNRHMSASIPHSVAAPLQADDPAESTPFVRRIVSERHPSPALPR